MMDENIQKMVRLQLRKLALSIEGVAKGLPSDAEEIELKSLRDDLNDLAAFAQEIRDMVPKTEAEKEAKRTAAAADEAAADE
jgi:hypothetical protein